MKNIALPELKRVTDQIFDHLIHEQGITSITLDKDIYWALPSEARYRLEAQPTAFDVGSLYDDWEILQAGSRDPADAVGIQLLQLAPLLRFIAEKVSGNGSRDAGRIP